MDIRIETRTSGILNFLRMIALMLLVFITDNPIFLYSTNKVLTSARQIIIYLLPIILVSNIYLKKGRLILNKEIFLVACSIVLFIIGSTFIAGDSINAAISLAMKIFTAFLIPLICDFDSFQRLFIKMMRIVILFSMLMFIIQSIDTNLLRIFPIIDIYSSNGKTITRVATSFFSNVYLSGFAIRNFGPFWEPGTFCAYLNIDLFILLFIRKDKTSITDIILIVVALITTMSLGGISAAVMIICISIFNKHNNHSKRNYILLFILAIASLYISNNDDILSLFADRLYSIYNGSTDSRWYSIIGNIVLFFRHPLFGNGLQSVDKALFEYYTNNGGLGLAIHNTNTMLIYYSAFGLFVGASFSWLWYKFCSIATSKTLTKLLIFISVFMMLSNEDLTQSYFFMIVPAYALYFGRPNQ